MRSEAVYRFFYKLYSYWHVVKAGHIHLSGAIPYAFHFREEP